MNVKRLILILLLSVALPAAAQITTVQLAHEVPLSDVRMPEHASGTMGFKPCDGCDFQTTRVSSDCSWLFNNQSMSFEDFQAAISALSDQRRHYLTVLHHLENDVITSISIVVR